MYTISIHTRNTTKTRCYIRISTLYMHIIHIGSGHTHTYYIYIYYPLYRHVCLFFLSLCAYRCTCYVCAAQICRRSLYIILYLLYPQYTYHKSYHICHYLCTYMIHTHASLYYMCLCYLHYVYICIFNKKMHGQPFEMGGCCLKQPVEVRPEGRSAFMKLPERLPRGHLAGANHPGNSWNPCKPVSKKWSE